MNPAPYEERENVEDWAGTFTALGLKAAYGTSAYALVMRLSRGTCAREAGKCLSVCTKWFGGQLCNLPQYSVVIIIIVIE